MPQKSRSQSGVGHTSHSDVDQGLSAPERRRLSEGYITRADLYAEAKRRGIEGRSKMTKAELRDLLNS